MLLCLQAAGVDNWSGFDFAFDDNSFLDLDKYIEENFEEFKETKEVI